MDNKKYELLTNDTINVYGHTLYRIRALRDFNNVKKGLIGGYIEKEYNLSHDGDCWVYNNAKVYGDAIISGNAIVFGNAIVCNDAWVFGNAKVCNNALVCNDVRISGNAKVYGDAIISGNAIVYGNAKVFDNAEIYGNAWVFSNARIFGDAKIRGNIIVGENAYISNDSDYIILNINGTVATFYKTEDKGIWVNCGCFNDSIEAFEKRSHSKVCEKSIKYAKSYFYKNGTNINADINIDIDGEIDNNEVTVEFQCFHVTGTKVDKAAKSLLEKVKEKKKALIGFDYEDESECIKAVKRCPLSLKYIKNQTEEMCLLAVKENPNVLQYVDDKFLYLFTDEYKNKPKENIYTVEVYTDKRTGKNKVYIAAENSLGVSYDIKKNEDIGEKLNFYINNYYKE